jgi:hypothetical protein
MREGVGGSVSWSWRFCGFLNNAEFDDYVLRRSGFALNLATPHAVELLACVHAAVGERVPRFAAGGRRGTVRWPPPGPDPGAHVFAKTGSLGGSDPSYAVTANGKQIAFSILSNNLSVTGKRVNDVIDSIVETAVNNSRK